jgi:hypothetical protein
VCSEREKKKRGRRREREREREREINSVTTDESRKKHSLNFS